MHYAAFTPHRLIVRLQDNINKAIHLYAYLDIENPMVAWEVAIGRLRSASESSDPRFGLSLWSYNLLRGLANEINTEKFIAEFALERIRQTHYPNLVSRLSGLYFFLSYDDALAALDRWGMQHKKKYISKIDFLPTALTLVDSEWITWNLKNYNREDWMHSYWKSESFGEKKLVEVLGLGDGLVLNQELRSEAYKIALSKWPQSTPLLACACCAFAKSELSQVAQIMPGILLKENKLAINFYIYMQQFDENIKKITSLVKECINSGEFPPVHMEDSVFKGWHGPDLRGLSYELSGESVIRGFTSIHGAI